MAQKGFIEVPAIEVSQPIGNFYVAVMNYDNLVHISFRDVRRLAGRQRDLETYIGIQRPLSDDRVKQIRQYVTLVDATFPTSIILAVPASAVKYDKKARTLTLRYEQDIARVLDGQHRIAGLQDSGLLGSKFQLNVTVFVDMEMEDQAIVFATINQTQTKVSKSLVADLFEFAKSRSPQKTAHNIARALNEKQGSPFYGKIKILGTADDKEKETITQAAFVESLLVYITRNKVQDRDVYRRGHKPDLPEGKEKEDLFLRTLFIKEKDADIANIVRHYFGAVSERWPRAWQHVQPEMILNKTTGFSALFRFMKPAYLSFNRPDTVIEQKEFSTILRKVKLKDSDFVRSTYLPGSGGMSLLFKHLSEQTGLEKT